MFVIGVAGQAQNGKDTLADRLALKLNEAVDKGPSELTLAVRWRRAAFAANVKKVLCETFGVTMEFVEKWKVVPENPPGFDMPMRQALQFIGDGFRKIQSQIWLNLAFRDRSPKIISDVRYVNEFLRVKKEGGLNILVARPDKINDDPNGSEAQIKPYIVWALDRFPADTKVVDLRQFDWDQECDLAKDLPPEHMNKFDFFVRNDGTKEELEQLVDKHLHQHVNDFEFGFPEFDNTLEEKCLLSA